MVRPEQSRSITLLEKGVNSINQKNLIFVLSKFLVLIISKTLPETNSHVLERIDFLQNPYLRKMKISGMNFCIDEQSFEKE